MLSLDEPMSLSGLSIFRDFNDRALFYYLPESPQLTVDGGQPMFELLVYRRAASAEGVLGGGFLTMTADLHVSPNKLRSVENELSQRFGVEARLSAVPIDSGTVRVSLLDATSTDEGKPGGFVERIIAASTPSLYGDERAAFTARLTQDGATLMQADLQDPGASPIVLYYTLTYTGLLPAYECKITIHFDQAYNYLKTRATFSSLLLETDVDSEMEELVKNGAISITEIAYHTDDPTQQAQRRQELNQLAKQLATWSFFSPGLTPGKVLAQNVRDLFAAPPNFQQILERNQQAIQGAMTGAPPPAAGAAQTQGAGDAKLDRPSGSVAASVNDPPKKAAEVPPPPGQGTVGAWEAAGRPHATWQLKQIEQRERQDIVYDLKQVSAVKRTISPQGQIRLLGDSFDLSRLIKNVSLDVDFFKRVQGTVTTSAPLAQLGLSSMTVQVRYGFKDDGTFPKELVDIPLTAAGSTGKFDWWLDARGTQDIEYRVTLNHIPDVAIGAPAVDEVSGWITTSGRSLDIDPREVSEVMAIQLEAGAIDWSFVKQIQATLIYRDGSARIDASRTVKLEQGSPSQTILVRPARERSVTVQAKLVFADGSSEDVVLGRTGSGLVLINQPPSSTKTVNVILADPLGRYEKVTLQLARPEGTTERTLELKGDLAKATWSFRPADLSDRTYRYKLTYFVRGAVREEDWATSSADQLVVGDVADDILEVRVLFLGGLQSGDMKALRLTLRYPGAPDWAEPELQKVFVASDAAATASPMLWRVPQRSRRDDTYQYSLQWIRKDNTQINVGPVSSTAQTLLVDPLTPEVVL